MKINKFNIRVYGILINAENQILLSDELIKGHKITKFPGGGLEFGEGIIDCLKREFKEETGNDIEVLEHLYTTDFFQQSAYNKSDQIISIYYLVKPIGKFPIKITENIFDFPNSVDYAQSFRYIEKKNISERNVTLPIDKIVANLLKEKFN